MVVGSGSLFWSAFGGFGKPRQVRPGEVENGRVAMLPHVRIELDHGGQPNLVTRQPYAAATEPLPFDGQRDPNQFDVVCVRIVSNKVQLTCIIHPGHFRPVQFGKLHGK